MLDHRRITIALLTATLATTSALMKVHAEDMLDEMTVVPRIGYNYKTVSFAVGDKDFSPFYQTLDLGLTLAYKAFYVSGNYDNSVKDYMTHNTTIGGNGRPDDNIVYFTREDWAATFGYVIRKGLSAFGGYKYGKNEIIVFSERVTDLNDFANRTVDMTLKGPFLGAGYSFTFERGSLDLSLAYAYMSGKIVSKQVSPTEERDSIDGTATGFSYGIAWSGPLAESFRYSTGIKANRYRFDADVPAGGRDEWSFDENHTIFFISAAKYF